MIWNKLPWPTIGNFTMKLILNRRAPSKLQWLTVVYSPKSKGCDTRALSILLFIWRPPAVGGWHPCVRPLSNNPRGRYTKGSTCLATSGHVTETRPGEWVVAVGVNYIDKTSHVYTEGRRRTDMLFHGCGILWVYYAYRRAIEPKSIDNTHLQLEMLFM